MKFLVDNALSPLIARGLREAGFEAVHVRDIGIHSASDQVIFEYARGADLTIVTADTDFGMLLALWRYPTPSVIIFRTSDKHPKAQLALLLNQVSALTDALSAGSVVVFEDTRIRVRALPIA